MNIYEIEQKIKKVIKKHLELPEEVIIDSNDEEFLANYDFNSIDALELLLMIEREFGVEIDDADLNADLLSTVHNLAIYIQKLCDK